MPISDYLKKASKKIKTEVNGIKDMANTAYKKNKLKNELEEMYSVLGRIRFSELSDDKENAEETEKIFNEIKRISVDLEELEKLDEEEQQQNENVCKFCGKQTEKDAVYCPYCGKQINEEA